MLAADRNYKKIKTLADFAELDCPSEVIAAAPRKPPEDSMMILRMMVLPKYGNYIIPDQLQWLKPAIFDMSDADEKITGIKHSWCYVTVRHGPVQSVTDDAWHFDGASFRTGLIPERNYIWCSDHPCQYKTGKLNIPGDFDPLKHNLFTFAAKQLENEPIQYAQPKAWYMINPFCLHRRDPASNGQSRTFIRISFPDIEGRDINNTQNPLMPTPAWGRDPVKEFRNNLANYQEVQ